MISNKLAGGLLAMVVAAFLGIGTLYAVYTPPWQAPDEPAHYNYIAQVAGEGCCPVIAPGDWDAAYLSELTSAHFPGGADLSPIEYEDHQPPLYYLVGSLVYRLVGGSLVALRLYSVVLGVGVVITAYGVVLRLSPHRRLMALAAATFVAFIPQHVAILASVNNDSLAELTIGVLLILTLDYLGLPLPTMDGEGQPLLVHRCPHPALLGLLVGVAFLTKLTIYFPAMLAVAVAVALRWRVERRPMSWVLLQVAWIGGVSLVLGALWWGRNLATYGWPDFLGQATHSAVVVGQLRTAELVAGQGLGSYLARLFTWTYHSFWGQFGWMAVPMPSAIYLLIGLFLLADLAGLVMLLTVSLNWRHVHLLRRSGLWVLAAVLLATLANYLYYNLTFVQLQGRYLFTALIPLAVLVAAGWRGWALVIAHRLRGERWEHLLNWLPLAALGWLPLLAVYALFHYVVPYLG